MIGHETIGPNSNFITPAGIGHQGNIFSIIIVAEKSLHAAVSPLREMMRYARYDDPRYPCHERNFADIFRKCQELSILSPEFRLNEKQARKDAADRQAIIDSLQEKLKTNPKSLVGNKGYRKYLKLEKDTVSVNQVKIEEEVRYDGKWVLKTNTTLTAEQAALKYKELWQVEQVFRDMKSVLDTRPIFHQLDETIRGHVFCSFLALVLRKELDRRLEKAGHCFEWADIKQDLKALREITIDDRGKTLAIRSECLGTCGKVFQAVGVAIPSTIREVA